MEDIAELAISIERERVLRARQRSVEDKLRAGGDLFDDVLERMRDGIRFQFPEFTAEQVTRELHRRLAIARKLEARP